MEGIYGWVKNIAIYLILITAVMNALPSNGYKKYIKLFTGMLLVILMIKPVTSLLNLTDKIDETFLLEGYKQELSGMKDNIKYIGEGHNEQLFSAYEQEISVQIQDIVKEQGLYPIDVAVSLEQNEEEDNYGGLKEVKIRASHTDQSDRMIQDVQIDKILIEEQEIKSYSYEELNIKNRIEEIYRIPSNQIQIYVQG